MSFYGRPAESWSTTRSQQVAWGLMQYGIGFPHVAVIVSSLFPHSGPKSLRQPHLDLVRTVPRRCTGAERKWMVLFAWPPSPRNGESPILGALPEIWRLPQATWISSHRGAAGDAGLWELRRSGKYSDRTEGKGNWKNHD